MQAKPMAHIATGSPEHARRRICQILGRTFDHTTLLLQTCPNAERIQPAARSWAIVRTRKTSSTSHVTSYQSADDGMRKRSMTFASYIVHHGVGLDSLFCLYRLT